MGFFNKKELKRIAELEEENRILEEKLKELDGYSYFDIQEKKEQLEKNIEELLSKKEAAYQEFQEYETMIKGKKEELASNLLSYEELVNEEKQKLDKEVASLKKKINNSENKLKELNEDIDYINDFSLYTPSYPCMNTEEYAKKIKENKAKQKEMIKDKKALLFFDNWKLDGSKQKGRAMNNDNMKMVLRAFNNECDNLISKVKYNNINSIEERIGKCASAIDKLNVRNQISITREYLQLKLDELHLAYEYACKKQEEKEAIRLARLEEKEIAKAKKELEEKKKAAIKEQKHYQIAREKLMQQLSTTNNKEEMEEVQEQIQTLDNSLETIEDNLKSLDYRQTNNRAGYVYVISNIGSFGENVYKIGMTRRLEPQDRIDELSSASVPFRFDVHALIFSDDAPALENALHKAFENKKVNMINNRKEFFRVSLDEIERVVKENHETLIEFTHFPEAKEYRETLKILK